MADNSHFRKAILAGLLSIFAATTTPSWPQAKSVPRAQRHEYRHEIEQAEETWRTAIVKGNSSALESLLSDDYTGITAKGAIQTKEQAVNSLKSGALQITNLTISDRKVRVYGATAVVTSAAELTGGKKDAEATGRYRYTRV